MKLELTTCALAAFLLAGSAAHAQMTPQESQDRSAMQHEDAASKGDSARLHSLDAQISALNGQIGHETGAKRDADKARLDRLQGEAQGIRNQAKTLSARDHAQLKNYKQDETQTHPQ
jgi:hypothetical protein